MSEMNDTTEKNGSEGDSHNSSTSPKTQTRKQWIIENVTSICLALLLVFMIRSSVVEAFKIPSGSMIPTLLIGDHIFVNKFAYGLKIPFSDYITSSPVYVIKREPPKRGDIIVFMYPKDESFYYIKRVIGVPGDSIEIKNKLLYVNGKPVSRDTVKPEDADKIFADLKDPRYSRNNLELYVEKMGVPEDKHVIMLDKNNFGDSFGPVTVPPESLFVMGDNRDFSNDSRFWGFVPYRNVKGKAMVIWLSLWISLADGQNSFHWERIGTVLH